MVRTYFTYVWASACRAWRGSINNALNWASVIGIGVVGAYREREWSAPLSDPHTWQGIVGWTLVYTAIAWIMIFLARLIFVAPFQLYHIQKTRADRLDGLRQIANDASRPPSFDIGFEYSQFIPEQYQYKSFFHHSVCRIWVESLEHRPIGDCRIVIEKFGPVSPIQNGALLIPDQRGSDEEKSAEVTFATTEKRYFKFLEIQETLDSRLHHSLDSEKECELVIKSDRDKTGFAGVFDEKILEFGRYFATIAVHGNDASSRRIDLIINAISPTDIHVTEADSTATYRKESSYDKEKGSVRPTP